MELFSLFGKIAIDNTEANKAINETAKNAQEADKKTESAFSGIGKAASTLGKGVLGVGAVMSGAFIGAVEGTRDYRAQMGLLESAFDTAGHSSKEAKNTYSDLNAVIGDTEAAVEASQHIALLADNEKEMQTWTDICTGAYATFGASLPIESLAESSQEVARSGELTGGLVDALVWAGISEEEFQEKLDKCTSEQERQDLIMNTLNDTYKDASNQYKETNKDIIESRQAQERLTDAMAELGAVGEPIMTGIKNAVASMAEKAVPVLQSMIDKTKDMITWFKENQSTVQTWVGVILGATTAIGTFLLIMNWSSIMGKASAAIKAVRLAVIAFNTALMANPIGLVVAAVLGLVAAFIYLWNNVDGFKQFWIDTWEVVKESASVAWEWIMQASSDAWKWIVKTWNSIGEWFSGQFDEIEQPGKDCMDAISKFFSNGWKMAKNAWSSTVSFFVSIWDGIKAVFSKVVSFYGGIFKKAWNAIVVVWNHAVSFYVGIWKGIQNVFKSTASWFGNIFKKAWNSIKNAFNAYKTFFNNLVVGIKGYFKNIGSWFGNIFSGAWSKIKNVFSGWGSFFGNLWDQIKKKFSSIGSTLGSTMSNAVKTGMNAIIGKIESTINKGLGLINSAIKLANKLGFSVGEVGTLKLPRLAEGTIVNRPTAAILGEAGAEAVVPLKNNKGWLTQVAKDLNELQGDQQNDLDEVLNRLDTMIRMLERVIERKIYLDSNVLVGELAPAMNMKLGKIYSRENRR